MLNSVKARPKQSKVERIMNKEVFIIFIVQLLFCLFSCLYSATWYSINKNELLYLDIDLNGTVDNAFWYNALVKYGNWMLIFTNFVPISLLVTLEMVKFIQGMFLQKDERFKSKEENIFV